MHAEFLAVMAARTSGSVLVWQVSQVIAAPAAGRAAGGLCSTVSEALWHGMQVVTTAGTCISVGVPGWFSERLWQFEQGGRIAVAGRGR